jgi:hypothetical protein
VDHVRQIWGVAREAHNRLAQAVWFAGWTIPLTVLVLALSMPYWRAAVADSEYAMAQQIDYEDATLCVKFGFAAGTDKHFACKLDLLELRRSHERLSESASIP